MNENVGRKQYMRQLNKLVAALKSMTHVICEGELLELEWADKDDAGFFCWKVKEWKMGRYGISNLRMSDFEINSASVIITDREENYKTIFVKI